MTVMATGDEVDEAGGEEEVEGAESLRLSEIAMALKVEERRLLSEEDAGEMQSRLQEGLLEGGREGEEFGL